MDYGPGGEAVAEPVLLDGEAPDKPYGLDGYLLLETTLAFIVAVLGVKAVGLVGLAGVAWLLAPLVLASAACVPVAIRGRRLAGFRGLNAAGIVASLAVLCWTCIAVFPLVIGGLWVLKSLDIMLPMPPAAAQERDWAGWLFYQFMYVALAEEVFFRGYVQSNIQRLAHPLIGMWPKARDWASIVLSAGCFAVAHMIVQGQIASLMTFWPGVVLGWLFIQTRSLVAPILFHGLANVCYVVMSGLFT